MDMVLQLHLCKINILKVNAFRAGEFIQRKNKEKKMQSGKKCPAMIHKACSH